MLSAAYGHTVGGAVGLAYVSHASAPDGAALLDAEFEVEVAGARFRADVSLEALYAPGNGHMRA